MGRWKSSPLGTAWCCFYGAGLVTCWVRLGWSRCQCSTATLTKQTTCCTKSHETNHIRGFEKLDVFATNGVFFWCSWWPETFFFTRTWGDDPIWLIFFKRVETTNWLSFCWLLAKGSWYARGVNDLEPCSIEFNGTCFYFSGQLATNLQSLVRITDCALTVYCFWGWTD